RRARDGERLPHLADRPAHRARHHHAGRLHPSPRRDLPRRALSRHGGEPGDRVHHRRHGERHPGIQVDRRQRLFRRLLVPDHRYLSLLALLFAAAVAHAGDIPLAERRSGYDLMSRETRAMQDDDTTNPALFVLMEGETLFKENCASCHADMKGVAARYPAIKGGKLVNLEQQVNACRVERQKAAPYVYESKELLALSAYIGRQ